MRVIVLNGGSSSGETGIVRVPAGVAYIAGEARTVQAVRQHLARDRSWPRRSLVTKPFWAPGKRGLD